jgi:hypothetical protein
LHWLDPIPYEFLRRKFPEQAPRLRVMPDPVEAAPEIDTATAREKLGLPTTGRITGCLGVLVEQKNVRLLMAAFRNARLSDSDRLMLAGPMSDSVRAFVDNEYDDMIRAGRLITIDRHLSLDEITLAVLASDLVCIPTPYRMGSSSFVIRAAAARRPVLADEFGWTGWVVPKFNLGTSIDMRDAGQLTAALPAALEQAACWVPSPAAQRFVRFHAAENFQAHWTARLRERLQLPRDPRYLPWECVGELT